MSFSWIGVVAFAASRLHCHDFPPDTYHARRRRGQRAKRRAAARIGARGGWPGPIFVPAVDWRMKMSFRITGLPAEPFAELFSLPPEALARRGAVRRRVDQENAFPCRISLTDARPGDEVVLVHYEHHPV